MELPDEVRRDVERAIGRWARYMDENKQAGRDSESRMCGNWLFGAEVILGLLGLEELARAAADAQRKRRRRNE